MKTKLLAAALLMSAAAMAGPQKLEIAITFDDLPAHHVLPAGMSRMEIATQVVDALKAGGVPPVYGLVNGSLTVNEPAALPVLKLWRDSGNLLGNHTWSHPGLSKVGAAAFEADTVKNEEMIASYAGSSDWHYFRYPFLDEGTPGERDAVRQFLAGRGYKIATVSTGLNDWDYPAPYARCLAKNDKAGIAKLEAMFMQRAEEGLSYSRAVSKNLRGQDVPYILLLHIGSFQAHMLPRLIAFYKSQGASFVRLEEALKNPAYAAYADPKLPAPQGDEAVLGARGLPIPKAPDNRMAELAAICQ